MAQTDRLTGLVGNAAFKVPVRVETIAAVTLAGEQTVNGVAVETGDRVLVKDQTNQVDNGIYVVDTGAWARADDFDGPHDVVQGSLVPVYSGAGTYSAYALATADVAIGTTAMTFELVNAFYLAAALADTSSTSKGDALVGVKNHATGGVARTQDDKNEDLAAVPEDLGAVGDGTTSDQTDLQAWVDSIPTSLGSTDPGHALSLRKGRKYKLTDVLTIGNKRIAFKGSAGGMGSGAGSIYQSVINKDFFDFTTGNSDVCSFEGFMLLGPASGTGRGLILGRSAQSWFDSRITNMWFASIGGKCIDGVNVQGGHITNSGFDSGATNALYITKGSDNVVALNRIFGMSDSGFTILDGSNNTYVLNHFDVSGAANDVSGAFFADVDAASSKLVRGTLLSANNYTANKNDVVIDGNSGVTTSNTGFDTALISGNLSNRAARRFLLATDANQLSVFGNYVSTCNQESAGTFDAFEFAGTCDSVYFSGNKVAANRTDARRHTYALRLASTVTKFTLGENDLPAGTVGKIVVASGAHVRALPGAPEYERFMSKLYDNFLGPGLNTFLWGNQVGSDPQVVAPAIVAQIDGAMKMVTGDDAAATMAVNGVQIHSALNWKTNVGSLVFEAKVKMSAITNVAVFVGLTSQVAALQCPINGSGVADGLTNNAANAVGFLFDTAMTTTNWWLASTGASDQNSAIAPVADTYVTLRMEFVGNTGTAVLFYINHALVGAQMNTPVTGSAALTPVIAAFSRGAASRDITADYILVEAERA